MKNLQYLLMRMNWHILEYILKMQDIINEVKTLNEDCKAEN